MAQKDGAWSCMASFGLKFLCVVLRSLMICAFAGWLLVWIMRPTSRWKPFWKSVNKKYTFFGTSEPFLIFFSCQILIISLVGTIYLRIKVKKKDVIHKRAPKFSICTYPIHGPFRTASIAEMFILAIFVALLVWIFVISLVGNDKTTGAAKLPKKLASVLPKTQKQGDAGWKKKIDIAASKFGLAGLPCLAMLFLPVSRKSGILQLINVPFAYGVRYHIWVANIMMAIFTAHGILHIVYWKISKPPRQELWTWTRKEYNGICGLATWITGMIIWLTSSYPIRTCKFELFYYSHHLYFLFMLGFALHVGDRQFCVILAGFFLFCIDRCLRFVQSQRHLATISVRMLSNETMQVCIPKYHQHKYHPASVIFLNLPAVSKFQWHPFTVASSSSIDHDHIMLLIKCRGDWTRKLRIIIEEQNIKSNYGSVLQAAYEGPYGCDLDYLKGYDVLFFIAGGSGISPFVGLLRELLCRHKLQQSHVPQKAILIWAVKKSEEIPILELVSPYSLCPDHQDTLNLIIEVYVTEEKDMYVDAENNKQATEIAEEVVTANHNLKHIRLNRQNSRFLFNMSSSTLPCLVMLSSMAGYLLIAALIHHMYIYPVDHNSNNVYPRWGTGLLVLIEMGIGIFVFGGMTTIAWLWWHSIGEESCVEDLNSPEERQVNQKHCPLPLHQTKYGSRPQFNELLIKHTEGLVKSNVGVFVCGPKTMQSSVALAIRSHTSLGLVKRKFVFHYHSLNFEY